MANLGNKQLQRLEHLESEELIKKEAGIRANKRKLLPSELKELQVKQLRSKTGKHFVRRLL